MENGETRKTVLGSRYKLCRIRLTEEVAVLCIIQYNQEIHLSGIAFKYGTTYQRIAQLMVLQIQTKLTLGRNSG